MDLRPSSEQEQLIQAFQRMLEKVVPPETVRAAEPTGFDPVVWSALAEMGVVPMGVPTDAGGWGASMLDLAFVAEELGRVLAPAPFVEVAVAARLLGRLRDSDAAGAALAAVLGDEKLVSLALHPSRDGWAPMVPAGAVADLVIVLRGDSLVLVEAADGRQHVANLGAMPVADLQVGPDSMVLATGPDAVAAFDTAVDEWLVLTAAALVGIASRSIDIGVAYASEREAWGRPIGSYQGVAHPLADAATAVDGARLLTQKAAWAADAAPDQVGQLAAMAFAFASEAARDASVRSLHFHGGYGFMLEYDIQLYFRRARAWSNVFGEPARAYDRVADKRYLASSPA